MGRFLNSIWAAFNQMERMVYAFLFLLCRDLQDFLKKYLWLFPVMTILFGSFYKMIRTIPGFSGIDRYNYYIMMPFFVLAPLFFMNAKKILRMDVLMVISGAILFLSFVLSGWNTLFQDQMGFLARIFFPVSVYFMFRYIPLSEKTVEKMMIAFSLIAAFMLITEFAVTNFFKISIFSFDEFYAAREGGTTGMQKISMNLPGVGFFLAPKGLMGQGQCTGSLFAALAIFFITRFRLKRREIRLRETLFYTFIILACLVSMVLTGSKTAVAIFFLMFMLIYSGINFFSIVIAPVVGLALTLLIYVEPQDLELTLKPYLTAFWIMYDGLTRTDFKYIYFTFFGQGESSRVHANEFYNEVGWFVTTTEIGLVNMFILFFIFYTYLDYLLRIKNFKRWQGLLPASVNLVFTLFLSSLHYNAVFIYPANILILAMIGYTSRQILEIQNQSKGVIHAIY